MKLKKAIARFTRKVGLRPAISQQIQSKAVEFTKQSKVYKLKVDGNCEYSITGKTQAVDKAHERGCIASVRYFDKTNKEITHRSPKLRHSKELGDYLYIPLKRNSFKFKEALTTPNACQFIVIQFHTFAGAEKAIIQSSVLTKTGASTKSSKPAFVKFSAISKSTAERQLLAQSGEPENTLYRLHAQLSKKKSSQRKKLPTSSEHSLTLELSPHCLIRLIPQSSGLGSQLPALCIKYFNAENMELATTNNSELRDADKVRLSQNNHPLIFPPMGAVRVEISTPSDSITSLFKAYQLDDSQNILKLDDFDQLKLTPQYEDCSLTTIESIADSLICSGIFSGKEALVLSGVRLLFQKCGQTKTLRAKYEWLINEPGISIALSGYLAHVFSLAKPLAESIPHLPPSNNAPNFHVEDDKILYCLNNTLPYNLNGYSSRSHSIAKAIVESGCEVQCLTRMGYPWERKADSLKIPKGAFRDSHTVDSIQYEAIKGSAPQQQSLNHYFQQAADQVYREAQRLSSTVILAASNYLTAIPAMMAARYAGLPFFYEVRGLWHLTDKAKLGIDQAFERHDFMEDAELFVAQQADHLFVQTPQLQQWFVDRGIDAAKISTLPNGIDQDLFHPKPVKPELFKKYGLKQHMPTIGYAGSIVHYEGHQTLLDALKKLQDLGSPVQCFLAGSGNSVKDLETYAKKIQLHDLHLIGNIPKHDVPDLLNLADIICIPRHAYEVTSLVAPLKPLEALALGKAVVASDLAPIKDQLRDVGYLAQPGNAESLKEAIQLALKEIESAKDTRIPKEFLWSTNAEKIQHVVAEFRAQRSLQSSSSTLNFAIISDEFSRKSFDGEHNMIVLDPQTWEQQLSGRDIDFFLCESTWEGQEGKWKRKVGTYTPEEFETLSNIISYCNSNGIPTVFWNKEDPVHFNRFTQTAAHFDHVFTTDSGCIQRYLAAPDSLNKTVRSLPFFANPSLHKHSPRQYNAKVCYAGTYYGERFPERKKHLDVLLDSTLENLTVFDRQSNTPDSPYKFPDHIQQSVNQGIDYEELVRKYPEFSLHINGNSVTNSPTMISRRVLEIAATGSFVLSTPSLALSELFNNLVPSFQNDETLREFLSLLEENPELYDSFSSQLSHFVLSRHTLQHRLVDIQRTLGRTASYTPEFLPEKKTSSTQLITVAGHDLKFAKEHISALRSSGANLLIDKWASHTLHDKNFSKFCINNSDKVWCEWTLGNAVFYSKNKLPKQRLVTRLHRQELVTEHLGKLTDTNVDKIITVSPHIKRELLTVSPNIPEEKVVTVPNFVNEDELSTSKAPDAQYTIGIVGIVPEMKRFDRAIDILELILEKDDKFTLRVKGKLPEDFPWMAKRPEEMAYFDAQYNRIKEKFQDRVIFDGFGNDMPQWFEKIGYILSTSDFESFHLSVADGAASGTFPVVFPWVGADELYPQEWIVNDAAEAAEKIFTHSQGSVSDRKEAQESLWPMIAKSMNKQQSIDKFLNTFDHE